MSYTIDYYDKEGDHVGSSSLLNFTGSVYTPEYLDHIAEDEIKRDFFPGAVEYDISKMETIKE